MSISSLDTSRLNLRRLENDDAESLLRTVGDPEVMEFWAPGPDNTVEKALERIMLINDHWNTHGFGDWAIIEKEHQRLIGFCGLHYITGMTEVNIGYAMEKSMWLKGLGTEVVKAILNFGFNILRLNEIVAVIDPRNVASIQLIQKCGLIYWKESSYMGKPRVEYKIYASKLQHSS